MRSLLDHQADGIEYTLHSHGIAANVVGGNISPRLIQFHIKPEAGIKFSRIAALSEDIALALGVNHCRITRDGYLIKVEVPRPDPVAVRLFPLMRNLTGNLPENAPILGLDENGVPLLLRLGSPDIAHVLVCGATGSGKSILARSMIASLALQNPPERLRLLLIDPKGRGYAKYNGLPNLICPVVTDALDGIHRLRWSVRHIEKREEQGVSVPALAIFIDEMADLMAIGGAELQDCVSQIVERGREVGIHLIACTQKPVPLAPVMRGNWPTRVVGRVATPQEARLGSGMEGSGAEKLMGQGDFLLFAKGEAARLQAAHISNEEVEQTVIHLGGIPGNLSDTRSARTTYSQAEPANDQPRNKRRYQGEYEQPEEAEEYYEPSKSRKAVPNRNFRQSAATSYQEAEPDAMGVSERLARYHESIRERRTGRSEEEDYPYYNPARATQTSRTQKQTATRSSQPTPWEDEEDEEPKRPIRAQSTPPNQRQSSTTSRSAEGKEGVRNLMDSARSGLFKVTKSS